MAVTVTPLDGNVNKAGTFTKVPADDPSNPAAGKLPTGAPLYYDAVTAGGDPSWPPLRQDMKPPLPNQPQRLMTKVLLEVDTPYSTCTWDLYNLKEKAVGDAVEAGHPMAMTSYKKAANLRDRPGRKLLVDDGNGQYMEQPLYQDYPVPVFKRVNGPRVVVDLPVPNYDPSADTAFNFVIDLFLPGSHEPDTTAPNISVTVDHTDGSVDVGSSTTGGGGTGTGTGADRRDWRSDRRRPGASRRRSCRSCSDTQACDGYPHGGFPRWGGSPRRGVRRSWRRSGRRHHGRRCHGGGGHGSLGRR